MKLHSSDAAQSTIVGRSRTDAYLQKGSWLIQAGSADHAEVIGTMYDKLFAWTRRQSQRTTRSEDQLIEMRTKSRGRGIVLGVYDENDTPLELTVKYRGRKAPNMKKGPR